MRRRRSVMRMHVLFTLADCLYSLMLSELRKTRTEQKKKRPNMRWAANDSIELSCLFSHCLRVRVPLRRAAPQLLKEAVMVKTKKKMMINFYLLDDNMAPLRVECHSGPTCPLVPKLLYPCQLGLHDVCTKFSVS